MAEQKKIEVSRPTDETIKELGVSSWPIWTHGADKFPWRYDEKETCLFLEGKVTVTAGDQTVSLGVGDMVVFPKGLECEWEIHEPVKKHYKFG